MPPVQSFLTVQPSGEGVGNAGADEDFAVTKETDMRDYRDAKAMAKAMREALAERGATITHSEALEIIARQFGLSNWNVLSAKSMMTRPRDPTTGFPSNRRYPSSAS
ncbi:hypothetical protein SS37A_21480 [Methylocystis iwaonis]|uniref:Glyoxalase-related protein domain-containing protein n=1 Tax=Methylocystis iwaonis TaxID=2885079 RepID=A0ABN6VFZ6_9HYPH|nr:hypothetical protein SS37A_21480 [Methylocystis iwaonis]